MNRRKFLCLTSAGMAASEAMARGTSQEAASENPSGGLRFLDERRGLHAFSVAPNNGSQPNIFLITLDMVSPYFYLPSRPFSR